MDKITVWTKQHENVWRELETTGRYIARREYIVMDLKEHAELVLEVYDWLVRNSPDAGNKPEDVCFPVWVSYSRECTMMEEKGAVILELELDAALVTPVNIAKWGTILNYSYIPSDEKDKARHQRLLADYGVSDPLAYMSRFYPHIRREIMNSWSRLFDEEIQVGSDASYGNIWEVRREWVTRVIQ